MAARDPTPNLALLEDLFERFAPPIVESYQTIEGRLDAVASRRKAMEWVTWAAAAITECHDDYIGFLESAVERGLTVLQLRDESAPEVPLIGVYALHPESVWRANAHAALLSVYRKDLRWSREAEDLQSYLLGYTVEERCVWHAYNDWRQLGWNGATIYFLMNRHSEVRTRELARRCIDPALGDEGIVAAFPSWGMAAKPGALAQLPPDRFLARAAVPHALLQTLYGPPASRSSNLVQTCVLTGDLIDLCNQALLSPLQLLTEAGWC